MIEILVCFIGIFVAIIASSLAVSYWHPPQGHQPKIDKPMGKPPTGGSGVRKS